MKKRSRSILQGALLLAAFIFLIFRMQDSGAGSSHGISLMKPAGEASSHTENGVSDGFPPPPLREGDSALLAQTPPYVDAIMNSEDKNFPRLECPLSDIDRYSYLRSKRKAGGRPKYFFALNIHQKVQLLPRLLGSIVEAIRILGPANCVLSVVEGRSDDGTFEVLKDLQKPLQRFGIQYFLQTSDVNPTANGTDRVKALAELRNMAVRDLIERPERYSPDTTVIFTNDVAVCLEDILELLHQKAYQGAEMTCAMDWTYLSDIPSFYDVWIARGMTGDTFFRIPAEGIWDYSADLFWNDAKSQYLFQHAKPFQVFSCWNGVVAFTAKPLMERKIKFRGNMRGECFQGEPKLFAKDMWVHGYGKIAVVPSVNVEYTDEAAKKIKKMKGYVGQHVQHEAVDYKINWESEPPAKVKCLAADWGKQKFVPWNEGLPDTSIFAREPRHGAI